MSLQLAPTELLDRIFQYLPRPNLLVCSSVCRSWQPPALCLFYKNIELSEKTKEAWLEMAHQTTVARNIGIFVRKLTVNLAFSTTLSQAEFLKLLYFIPYVKSIDLESSGYKLHYLSYLKKRSTDCISYLEDIYTGDLFTDYQLKQYFLCAYSFRDSLKHLTLRNPDAIYEIEGQSGSGLSFLKKFMSLNHVSIISDLQIRNNELKNLFVAFRSCPKLVSFSYQNSSLLLDQEEPDEYLIHSKNASTTDLNDTRINAIELIVPNLTTYYIKNIVTNFPTSLNQFTVSMTQTDYRDWIQEHNELFGIYLGLVKAYKILISNNKRRYSMSRRAQTPKELSRFWKLFRSARRNRKLFTTMHFSFPGSGTKPDFIFERDEHNMTLSYNSENLEDFCTNLEEFSPVYSSGYISPCNTDPLVDLVLIELLLHTSNEINQIRCKKIIDTFKTHACNLKSLSIEFTTSSTTNSKENMSIQLKSNSSTTSNIPIPNYALLKNIDFETLSIKSITSLLPQLTTLKIINCKPKFQEKYIYDLIGIEHINQLVLDLSWLTRDQTQIWIQVEEISKNRVHTLLYPVTKQRLPIHYFLNSNPFNSNCIPVVIIKCRTINEIVCTDTNFE
ncbi:hypothetical protein BD770DRAFT_382572 [Pilaira anomala]|nr:hypothetical protein BD770DRAFT_382572 [Pilaira anomala]